MTRKPNKYWGTGGFITWVKWPERESEHSGLLSRWWWLFMSMKWDCVSELRLPTGVLSTPQVTYEYGEPRWNAIDRDNPKNSEKKPVPLPLYPPQITPARNRSRTWASVARGRRLTAWAMARPITVFRLWMRGYVHPDRHTSVSASCGIQKVKMCTCMLIC
jgi:hypothetical protein